MITKPATTKTQHLIVHFRAHTIDDNQLAIYLQRCSSAMERLQHASYDHLLAKNIALRELWLPLATIFDQLFARHGLRIYVHEVYRTPACLKLRCCDSGTLREFTCHPCEQIPILPFLIWNICCNVSQILRDVSAVAHPSNKPGGSCNV